jgi:hypothetical protein
VLQAEGISVVGMLENADATACRQAYETLLCWVLVDPFQKHGFCRLEMTVLMPCVSFGRNILHILIMLLLGFMLANLTFSMVSLQCAWSFISVVVFVMSAVQTSVKSQLSVGYVNSRQISGQPFITPKYCFAMAMLLMNFFLM